jgi:hypothetical protein
MQQAKRPRIESRNPNIYFLGIGRFAPKAANGARSLSPQSVCTENLNPYIMVMKAAKDRA